MAPKKGANAVKQTVNADKVLEDLPENIGSIFEQAQLSLANHKKNCVALWKVHIQAAEIIQSGNFVGEKAFQDVFIDMLLRVVVVKKGPANADRVVKYVGAFVKFMNEKVVEAKTKTASSSVSAGRKDRGSEDEDEETSTSRFVARLLKWLLQGFLAKNKNVRHRCIQTVGEMIAHLGEIDEDTYNELRDALLERLNDKESLIRAHAVIALSKLIGSEDPDDFAQGEQTIQQVLLQSLSLDPAPEVRRAALLHIPLVPTTIDGLLSRTRDVDAVTRKLVYTSVLQAKLTHPRQLTIAQRELIVRDGLGDREPGVRVAAGKLVGSWFDGVIGEEVNGEEEDALKGWQGDDAGMMKGAVKFLGVFDVVGPGEAVAVDAMLSIFTTRSQVMDAFVFPAEFWQNLMPESVLLARVFVEHCVSTKDERRLESSSMPVVTAFAFIVQQAYNDLLSVLEDIEAARVFRAEQGEENEEDVERDEQLDEELSRRQIVMSELLRLALKLDYGDEIGRRKVFSVVKDMLAHPQLPPGLIERCLDVLKEIMPSERELIRVIVEIVVDLREGDEVADALEDLAIPDDQSEVDISTRRDKSMKKRDQEDMSPEERRKADMSDIRCLMLCIAMLERVNGTFEDNSTLEGILGDLIIPSVKRKELAMREKALVSLGLCCLIARNMALSSFQLFLSQAQNAPVELKVQVLKVIMDLLIMYDQDFFGRSEETSKQIVDFLLGVLENEEEEEAQAVLVTGFCKLLLAGIVTDPKVLMCLALLYISPTTKENQQLRQCLAYFFPVYAYSSAANQSRVQSIFTSTFNHVVQLHEELDDDQDMITLNQFGLLFIDWTNPHKLAEIAIDRADAQPAHAGLAADILIALYDSDRTVDQDKTLCQLLNQLNLEKAPAVEGEEQELPAKATPKLSKRDIWKIHILLSHKEDQNPFENGPNEKLFDKFRTKFEKLYETELKEIDPKDPEFLDDEFRDVYQSMGLDVPEEGENITARVGARSSSGKRSSAGSAGAGRIGKAPAKAARKSTRAAAAKSRKALKEESDEEDDDEEEEEEEEEDEEEAGDDEDGDEKASVVEEDEGEKESMASHSVNGGESETEEGTEAEAESRDGSPTPPPKAKGGRKPAAKGAKKAKPPPKASAVKSKRATRQESESEDGSDEENIPPSVASSAVTSTPTKKTGIKRLHTPGSVSSPANRKKTRVKAPLSVVTDATPTNSDMEDVPPSPTPTKPVRAAAATRGRGRGRGRGRAAAPATTTTGRGGRRKAKEPTPEEESQDEDDAASEVASLVSNSIAADPSSDDFGGY